LSIFWKANEKGKGKEDNNNNKISSETKNGIKTPDTEIEDSIIRSDVLLEISTFLARRWSNNNDVTVTISRENKISTNIEKRKITLPGLEYFYGNIFQKYRQWRTLLWYESMRMRFSFKIYDTDIAFG
jgi:hypothetical protein